MVSFFILVFFLVAEIGQLRRVLSHPNLSTIVGYTKPNQATVAVVSEIYENQISLRQYLQNETISYKTKIRILNEVADVLNYLHSNEVTQTYADKLLFCS